MAITKNAKKAIRVSARKRVFNIRRKAALHGAVKDVQKSTTAGDASAKLASAYKAIDKAAKRGVIKKNTASRKKSRLAREVARIAK